MSVVRNPTPILPKVALAKIAPILNYVFFIHSSITVLYWLQRRTSAPSMCRLRELDGTNVPHGLGVRRDILLACHGLFSL
jgi:hypothetical protein